MVKRKSCKTYSRVGQHILRLPTPFESCHRDLESAQTDATGRERARQADRVGSPSWVGAHDLSLSGDILRRKVGELGRLRDVSESRQGSNATHLCLDPTKWLHILQQEFVLGQFVRQLDTIIAASLRYPDNSLDLLDLLIIGRRDTIQVSSNLGSQIGIDDERLQYVLGHDVGKARRLVLDIIVAIRE